MSLQRSSVQYRNCWHVKGDYTLLKFLSRFMGMGIGSGMQINIFSCYSFLKSVLSLIIFPVKKIYYNDLQPLNNSWQDSLFITSNILSTQCQKVRGQWNQYHAVDTKMLLPRECPISNFSHQAEPPAYEL